MRLHRLGRSGLLRGAVSSSRRAEDGTGFAKDGMIQHGQCPRRLRTTVRSARSVTSQAGPARRAPSLMPALQGHNATERLAVLGLCCRQSTTLANDDAIKPRVRADKASTVPVEGDLAERRNWGNFREKLKALTPKSTLRSLSATRLLQACLNNVERKVWYTEALMTNEFLRRHLWLSTNVWVLSRRLLREGDEGKRIQEILFDELWRETIRQMRSIEVDEMMMKKYLIETQQHTLSVLCQYDHAYTLESRQETLGALGGAIWRGIYGSNPNLKLVVRRMADHVDQELQDVYAIDKELFFQGCIDFGLPPLGIADGVPCVSHNKSSPGDRETQYVSLQSGLVSPDDGPDGQGMWRASLAESGKVYFWHTGTKKRTYDKPEGVDYVPSVMPAQENNPQATARST